ncbi:hypothetical protein GO279_04923 [Ralstonia solanacearum]|nr:hypothetical protein [Ralstonia solanacearum]
MAPVLLTFRRPVWEPIVPALLSTEPAATATSPTAPSNPPWLATRCAPTCMPVVDHRLPAALSSVPPAWIATLLAETAAPRLDTSPAAVSVTAPRALTLPLPVSMLPALTPISWPASRLPPLRTVPAALSATLPAWVTPPFASTPAPMVPVFVICGPAIATLPPATTLPVLAVLPEMDTLPGVLIAPWLVTFGAAIARSAALCTRPVGVMVTSPLADRSSRPVSAARLPPMLTPRPRSVPIRRVAPPPNMLPSCPTSIATCGAGPVPAMAVGATLP